MQPQNKNQRKSYPSDITVKQFRLIEPLVRRRQRKTGRPAADLYKIVNGALYMLSTGCRWRDLPHDYGVSYVTCYRHFIHWIKTGKFQEIFEELKQKANKKTCCIGGTATLTPAWSSQKSGQKTLWLFRKTPDKWAKTQYCHRLKRQPVGHYLLSRQSP